MSFIMSLAGKYISCKCQQSDVSENKHVELTSERECQKSHKQQITFFLQMEIYNTFQDTW